MLPPIAFNIWTYNKDEEKTLLCVSSILRFCNINAEDIFIWNDSHNPISIQAKKTLKDFGCIISDTFYKRPNNLNSKYIFFEMIKNYNSCCDNKDYDFFLKIDPDTIFVKKGFFNFIEDKNFISQSKSLSTQEICGFIYFNKELLLNINQNIKSEEDLTRIFQIKGFHPKGKYSSYCCNDWSMACLYEYFFGKDKIKNYPRGTFWYSHSLPIKTNIIHDCGPWFVHLDYEIAIERMRSILDFS